jgi:uncharacterized protein (DUF1330 family)
MAAYLVVSVEVTNPVGYQDYLKIVGATIEQFGGKYLVRGGRTEVLEGGYAPKRFVMLEFADAATAKAWWESPEYAEAKAIRQANARSEMFIAEGV